MLGEYKKLLVPVDGSEQSEASFERALAIAKVNQATMYIVYVGDSRNLVIAPEYSPLHANDAEPTVDTAFLDRYKQLSEEAGVPAEVHIRTGNPMAMIAETLPEELECDVIIIGATGKGAVARALVGSVSNYVIKHAPCDVLITRS